MNVHNFKNSVLANYREMKAACNRTLAARRLRSSTRSNPKCARSTRASSAPRYLADSNGRRKAPEPDKAVEKAIAWIFVTKAIRQKRADKLSGVEAVKCNDELFQGPGSPLAS